MGYHIGRFIENVDQNIICSICSSVLEDAVLTPCGHAFCSLCLDTWLARPNTKTCPECRSPIASRDIRPIHAIRNLINGLDIVCDNKERGCMAPQKVENVKSHVNVCGYSPIECAGCGVVVNRSVLSEHHLTCEVIQSIVIEERQKPAALQFSSSSNSSGSSSSSSMQFRNLSNEVNRIGITDDRESIELLCNRVTCLENDLRQIRRDLQLADHKNKRMERELRKTRRELEDKIQQLTEQQFIEFDPDYEYGYTPESILKLSAFISRFLNQKPQYVDTAKIFKAIKRCFDNYGLFGEKHKDDMHMLLATAYASNWLTRSQRVSVHCWTENMLGMVATTECSF